MQPAYLLLCATSVLCGKIVFQEEKPRSERRFGGTDPFPPNTWAALHPTTPGGTPTTAANNQTSEEGASCPEEAPWCIEPAFYPKEAILRAVERQGAAIQVLFPVEKATKAVLTLDPSLQLDDAVLGLRSALPEEGEGSGEEGSAEGSGAVAREGSADNYPEEEFPEDGFENICGLTTEYIMPRAAKNKEGQFRFIVNHPEGGGEQYIQLVRVARCEGAGEECGWGLLAGRETRCQQEFLDHKLVALSESGEQLVIDTFTFPSCCTCLMKQDFFKRK